MAAIVIDAAVFPQRLQVFCRRRANFKAALFFCTTCASLDTGARATLELDTARTPATGPQLPMLFEAPDNAQGLRLTARGLLHLTTPAVLHEALFACSAISSLSTEASLDEVTSSGSELPMELYSLRLLTCGSPRHVDEEESSSGDNDSFEPCPGVALLNSSLNSVTPAPGVALPRTAERVT
jgi:hypothetical protein